MVIDLNSEARFAANAVLAGAKHLPNLVVVGVELDGRLYVASTHSHAEAVELCSAAIDALKKGDVDRKVAA